MSDSGTFPKVKAVQPSDAASVGHWLDALVTGSCTQDEFLAKVHAREAENPEVTWEALSLIDQYFRRKRLSQEVFQVLKSGLQQGAFGPTRHSSPPRSTAAPVLVQSIQPIPDVAPITAAQATPSSPPLSAPPPTTSSRSTGAAELRVGDVLRDRYRIIGMLRSGRAVTLVEAVDQLRADAPEVRQRVAIQVMNSVQHDPELLQRICQLQELSHPGIVRVFDFDEDAGKLLVTMELLSGITLQQLIEQNSGARMALPAARAIIQTVASALAYAHSQDVAHGDVSAANIIVTNLGEVRLGGFEIRGRDLEASAVVDRVAFAQLVYALLTGVAAPGGAPSFGRALRKPSILTRSEWRILSDTLTGRERRATPNVLTVFAGDGSATARVSPLQAFAPEVTARKMMRGWLWVAVAGGVAGYLLLSTNKVPVSTTKMVHAPEPKLVPASIPAPAVKPEDRKLAKKNSDAKTEAVADDRRSDKSVETQVAATQPAAAPVVPPTPPEQVAPPETPEVAAKQEPPLKNKPAILDLPSATLSVQTDQPVARIWVRRRGGLRGVVPFVWWTESGSARVDQDFSAIEQRTAEIPDGAKGVELFVPLIANPGRDQPRTFYVKIDEPGADASLGKQTLMQVTIVPPGYVEPAAEISD